MPKKVYHFIHLFLGLEPALLIAHHVTVEVSRKAHYTETTTFTREEDDSLREDFLTH